jgi:hypothetical protein
MATRTRRIILWGAVVAIGVPAFVFLAALAVGTAGLETSGGTGAEVP